MDELIMYTVTIQPTAAMEAYTAGLIARKQQLIERILDRPLPEHLTEDVTTDLTYADIKAAATRIPNDGEQ